MFSDEKSSNLKQYINSVLSRKNGEYVNAYTIDTTPEEESKMIEKAMEEGDGIGFSCASNVSEVLNEIGFNKGITPGAIEKQLKKSEKVTEIKVYKNEE